MAKYYVRKKWKPGKHADYMIGLNRKAANALGYSPRIKLYTVREVAVMLRHAPAWIRTQIKSGKMRAVRYGYQYFVMHKEVARWMGDSRRGSAKFMTPNPPRRKGQSHDFKPRQVESPPSETEMPQVQEGFKPRVVSYRPGKRESSVRILLQEMLGRRGIEQSGKGVS